MLPDFASMAGTRLSSGAPVPDPDRALAHGIALHHRTDDAFHGDPWFTSLVQATLDALSADGVPRGAARAVGHVGVEMLIDGELLRRPGVADAYTAALARRRARVRAADGAERWAALRARCVPTGPRTLPRSGGESCFGSPMCFARRPRLALDAPSRDRVRAALPSLQGRVIDGLDALMDKLRARLDESVEEV